MFRGPKRVCCQTCFFTLQKQNQSLRRFVTPTKSNFTELAEAPSFKYQVYLSTSTDPYLNLSIEHHLLHTTPSDSTVLLLYANRPCVVIGRNQNPWLETNLREISLPRVSTLSPNHDVRTGILQTTPSHVELVRRRSGGGTVFHGPGNVNYSVICPSETFTRDKHAWMVARALQTMNVSAHVNARHDIVLLADKNLQAHSIPETLPSEASPPDPSATAIDAADAAVPRKVSGSAYKLTRGRAMHHGTCLLCTPYLQSLGTFLASPARGYLEARGVDSVRSPVANVLPLADDIEGLSRNVEGFYGAVLRSFADLYPAASLSKPDIQCILDAAARTNATQVDGRPAEQDAEMLTLHPSTIGGVLNGGLADLASIHEGMAELRSTAWLFGQTPRFTLSTLGTADAESYALVREDISLPPSSVHLFLGARNGVVTGAAIATGRHRGATWEDRPALRKHLEAEAEMTNPPASSLNAVLRGRELYSMGEREWDDVLETIDLTSAGGSSLNESGGDDPLRQYQTQRQELRAWLRRMLPLPREVE